MDVLARRASKTETKLGGATIFADKPFEVGDSVIVEGTVETVGFRSTRVRTLYNSLVSVPNGNLTNTGIYNMGQLDGHDFGQLGAARYLTWVARPAGWRIMFILTHRGKVDA